MKQTIRIDTFETNSSSEHSLVVTHLTDDFTDEEIRNSFILLIDKDIETGEEFLDLKSDITDYSILFGFDRGPFQILSTYAEKLRYYVASKYWGSDEEFDEYIKQVIEKYNLPKKYILAEDSYPTEERKYYYGYVDHQSSDVMQDGMEKMGLSFNSFKDVDKFCKSKKYVVIVDGDEYCIFDSYNKLGLINGNEVNIYAEE